MASLRLQVNLGPFTFEWDRPGRQILIWRGEDEQVGSIENVFEDTWRAFLEDAFPYQGPG
jgi:hypothetical protein